MTEIDNLIERVEHLYQHVTGHPPGAHTNTTQIPADHDAVSFVESQIDRLIQTLAPLSPWTPAVQAYESEDEVVVSLDVPGVARDALEVTFDRGMVSLTGHRRQQATPPNAKQLAAESPSGPFRRALALPPSFGQSEITARLVDGVLELRCRRGTAAPVTAKTISVQ